MFLLLIINQDSELPSEITDKRNNVYKYYAEKNTPNGYSLKEKNGVTYIERNNNLNEIKRLQELAGINEIKINNPNISFPYIINNIQELESITKILQQKGYEWAYKDYEFSDISVGVFPSQIKKLNYKENIFYIQFNRD